MGAIVAKAVSDLRRRRLQTGVLAVVLFLASAAAAFALSVLIAANEPFERAFADASGAHLVVDFDASVDEALVAATAGSDGVTASAGPWPVTVGGLGRPGGGPLDGQVLSGRADPAGAVDQIALSTGRWWRTDAEAVVSWDAAEIFGLRVGDALALYGPAANAKGRGGPIPIEPGRKPAPREPMATVTVVGIARSVSTPDVGAWLSRGVIDAVAGGGGPDWRMLYRSASGTAEADLTALATTIAAGLPADAVIGTFTFHRTRTEVEDTAMLYVPILLAFAVFALAAAAFTIANVVSGIVLTGFREIGVMKAVGFTPGQVSAIFEAQILAPVAVGSVAGALVGTVASVPTVERLTESFGLPPTFTVSVPAVVGVIVASLGVAALAAALPAMRAGRLSPAHAIANAPAPSRRPDGGRLRRLGLELPVALPLRLGVAAGVAHPGRAMMTLGAVAVGVAAATFALGVNLSLLRIMAQVDRMAASPVRAELFEAASEPNAVTRAIPANPDTERSVGLGATTVRVGRAGEVPFVGYDGDASWLGYSVIQGRWFTGPGEVVASTNLIRQAGLTVGDVIEVIHDGRTISVRLVGEIFDLAEESPEHLILRGSMADVATLDPSATVDRWEIRPVTGVEPEAYAQRLTESTGFAVGAFTIRESTADEEFLLFLSVVAMMGAVLIGISLGGVFNTVLLETRQRTREIAVLKALGMGPRSVVSMVVASVVPVGVAAGLIGVPIGLACQRAVLSYMGEVAARTAIPEISFDVFGPIILTALAASGLVIAAVGAWLPAQRAAWARIAPVLQAE